MNGNQNKNSKYTMPDDDFLMEDIDDILAEYQKKEAAKAQKRSSLAAERPKDKRRRSRRVAANPAFEDDGSDEIANTVVLPIIEDDDEIPNTTILPVIEDDIPEQSARKKSAGRQDTAHRQQAARKEEKSFKEQTVEEGSDFRESEEEAAQKEKTVSEEKASSEEGKRSGDRTPIPIRKKPGSNEFGRIPEAQEEQEKLHSGETQPLLGMKDAAEEKEAEAKEEAKEKKPIPWKKILAVGAALASACLIIAYGYGVFYYSSHFLPGTAVEQVRVDNLTAEEAQTALAQAKEAEDRTLQLLTKEGTAVTMDTAPMAIRRQYQGIQEAIDAQQKWLFPIVKDQWKDIALDYTVSHDSGGTMEALQALEICDPALTQQPVDACVVRDETTGTFAVQPPEDGNTIDTEILAAEVDRAVDSKEHEVDIQQCGAYLVAAVREDDPSLNHLAAVENALEAAEMKVDMGADLVLELTGDDLRSCLRDGVREENDPDPATLIDDAKFDSFMDRFARSYTTKSASGYRYFLAFDGTRHALATDYGWEMDKEATAKELRVLFEDAAVKALADPNHVDTYPSHQITAVWTSTAVSHGERDTGASWVEVNLTDQKLYCIIDGELKLTTDVVSGRDSTPARRTPTGMFAIRLKTTGRYLTGYNRDGSVSYRSFVHYWMPVYNNIGLHDATWRYAFGGDLYKTGGSHGCVNLPLAAAKELYGLVYKEMPVIIYK